MSQTDVDVTVRAAAHGSLPAWITERLRISEESGGRAGRMEDSTAADGKGLLPCRLLLAKGCKSGREFTRPLIDGTDGVNYVSVGPEGGADTQPGWYSGLFAHAEAGTGAYAGNARLIDDDERERERAHLIEFSPPCVDYPAKKQRQIPLSLLEPAT